MRKPWISFTGLLLFNKTEVRNIDQTNAQLDYFDKKTFLAIQLPEEKMIPVLQKSFQVLKWHQNDPVHFEICDPSE